MHLGQIQFNKMVDYSGDVSEIKVDHIHTYMHTSIYVLYTYFMYVCMYVMIGFENNESRCSSVRFLASRSRDLAHYQSS